MLVLLGLLMILVTDLWLELMIMISLLLVMTTHMLHDNLSKGKQTAHTNIPQHQAPNNIAIKGNRINLSKQGILHIPNQININQ